MKFLKILFIYLLLLLLLLLLFTNIKQRHSFRGDRVKSKQHELDLYVISTNCDLCGRRGYVVHVKILACTALAEVW